MSSATPARRGPYGKTRGRVETIATAAYELVAESGHRGLTMAEVARRCDLTEAQVLYHFPSRDHLLVAALRRSFALAEQRRVDAHVDEVVDPEENLAASVTHGLSDPQMLRLFVSLSAEATDPEHPAHVWFREHHAGVAAAYADLLVRLQRRGWAHPDVDPQQFARQLAALWDGLQAQWLVDPAFDLAREVAAGMRVLARRDAVLARAAVEALADRL